MRLPGSLPGLGYKLMGGLRVLADVLQIVDVVSITMCVCFFVPASCGSVGRRFYRIVYGFLNNKHSNQLNLSETNALCPFAIYQESVMFSGFYCSLAVLYTIHHYQDSHQFTPSKRMREVMWVSMLCDVRERIKRRHANSN